MDTAPGAVGGMRKRRTTLADGRYLIYYTFGEGGGEERRAPQGEVGGESKREPEADAVAEEERRV